MQTGIRANFQDRTQFSAAGQPLKVIALGELLIDFTPVETPPVGNHLGVPVFAANPGGAPANVCAALVRFGVPAGFVGMVGPDAFGQQLRTTLMDCGVDTAGLVVSRTAPTTLAFVHLSPNGERTFHFYRHPGADTQLSTKDIDWNRVASTPLFHFGSVSLTDDPARQTTLAAAQTAKQAGRVVSFDVNLRPPLWKDLEVARQCIHEGLTLADVVKVSEEELMFLCPQWTARAESMWESDGQRQRLSAGFADAIRRLADAYRVRALLVTLGADGSLVYVPGEEVIHVPSAPVEAVDTTGAGDAFMAGVLARLSEFDFDLDALTPSDWLRTLRFANAAGALTATKRGAIPALPSEAEVWACLSRHTGAPW
ncbi:carbohydrate kinase family protein [Alicyclobacillus kakegawensis]|uniref:carbohydrate kinase family protein n=1 Tax=Alicyclobacillus kakegawensis TaxID=392012 RepID=UPI0008308A19|nr:carbohydrate kinase [Alicyclobacillus kakegawensis]